MQKLAIGMTCAPRKAGDASQYTHKSILSLRAAGFTDPLHLFCEPGRILVPNSKKFKFDVIQTSERGAEVNETLGCYRNWRTGLDWLLANVDAEAYLMLQDDVVWRSDGAAQIAAAQQDPEVMGPHIGFISAYTSRAMVKDAGKDTEPKGWTSVSFYNNAFWGALAICMPAASARLLTEHSRYTGHDKPVRLDVLIGNVFRDMNMTILVHVPSLCDHIGAYSTLGRHKFKGIAWGRKGYCWRPHP